MTGQRPFVVFMFCVLLALAAGVAWAEQATAPPEEGEDQADAGAESETGQDGSVQAEGEEEPAVEGGLEAGENGLPDAPEAHRKLRPPPGRAVSADEIKGRTRQLSKLMETSELRLRALAERVLSGKLGRAKSTVVFRNEMGTSFKLIRAVFALDGAPIFTRTDESGELGSRNEIELFNGSIVPGEHRLSVNLEYRGHGYGIFSYLKGYRFKVRSSYAYRVAEGKQAQIRIVGYEKGDQNTPLEERPDIRYVERVETLSGSGD